MGQVKCYILRVNEITKEKWSPSQRKKELVWFYEVPHPSRTKQHRVLTGFTLGERVFWICYLSWDVWPWKQEGPEVIRQGCACHCKILQSHCQQLAFLFSVGSPWSKFCTYSVVTNKKVNVSSSPREISRTLNKTLSNWISFYQEAIVPRSQNLKSVMLLLGKQN